MNDFLVFSNFSFNFEKNISNLVKPIKKFLFLLVLSFKTGLVWAQWDTLAKPLGFSFRSIAFAKNGQVWVGGSKGAIFRSNESGKVFEKIYDEKFRNHDFRGIQITDNQTIWLMTSGPAEEGKAFVFNSTDNGQTWNVNFNSSDQGVFFDGLAFGSNKKGVLLGDPIKEEGYLLITKNGGKSWQKVENLPKMKPLEASYAASNSSIVLHKKQIWFCTQNRLFYSKNFGKSWKSIASPFENGTMQGIYAIKRNSEGKIVAVGGDYNGKEAATQFGSFEPKKQTWIIAAESFKKNATEGLAMISDKKILATGTGGSYVSEDNGLNWTKKDDLKLHTVACKNGNCYAAGNGIILKWKE
jgi:photosystem II stability/assembly factor-like uncharacterized protein